MKMRKSRFKFIISCFCYCALAESRAAWPFTYDVVYNHKTCDILLINAMTLNLIGLRSKEELAVKMAKAEINRAVKCKNQIRCSRRERIAKYLFFF